ncbi:phage portal protein [Eubacterium maltosivorans]|uniref:phage portal protein n=1 Tax=Eubacterium maltosivorans TaxID=2041044 RepID=UPI003A8E3E4C
MLTKSEIEYFINADRQSKVKRYAAIGERYYNAEHDIKDYRLFYINEDGIPVEDKNRSNIKISHAFFTELVDQKAQYMLSGNAPLVQSDNQKLQAELDEYFGDAFKSQLTDLITSVGIQGMGYLYIYKGKDDRLKFQAAPGLRVVEVEAKEASDKQDHVIYWKTDKLKRDGSTVRKIEVWDKEQVYYYRQEGSGKIEEDPEQEFNPAPHYIYEKDGNYYGYALDYIPFFRIDNNEKQYSDLKPIKSLIDDYDLMSCGLSNNLQDITEGIYVVKGFEGNDLGELIHNIHVKKAVGVGDAGNVDIKTIDIPYQARQAKLELDEKNIYRFGMGFNSAQIGDGNITNIVIKSRYALLDLKCNKLELRLKGFMKQLIQLALDEINTAKKTDYQIKDVKIVFEREVMTNASDNAQIKKTEAETQQIQINALLAAASQLDPETLVEKLCGILDVDFETVKDRLDLTDPRTDLNQASELLMGKEEKQIEAVVEDTVSKPLNGAQTNSLINIVVQYQSGILDYDQAISMITISAGISDEQAKKLLGKAKQEAANEPAAATG